MRAAVITVSTSRSRDGGDDESGRRLEQLVSGAGGEVVARELLPDDQARIAERLCRWCDSGEVDLVLTTGGTGLAPSDRTPEATLSVLDREVPGLAEAIRLDARRHTDRWPLSRGVAGTRGRCLVVNLPGSPSAVSDAAAVLTPVLPHALALLADRPVDH
jgi:molybdenum cofactor synthesis domain-containing protein